MSKGKKRGAKSAMGPGRPVKATEVFIGKRADDVIQACIAKGAVRLPGQADPPAYYTVSDFIKDYRHAPDVWKRVKDNLRRRGIRLGCRAARGHFLTWDLDDVVRDDADVLGKAQTMAQTVASRVEGAQLAFNGAYSGKLSNELDRREVDGIEVLRLGGFQGELPPPQQASTEDRSA